MEKMLRIPVPPGQRKRTFHRQRFFSILFLLFVLYAALGALCLPRLVRTLAEKKLTQLLGRPTTIGRIRLNPFNLALQVEDFTVQENLKPQVFIHFDNLFLTLRPDSIVRRALIIKRLHLERPYLSLVRTEPNRYNFGDLIPGRGQAGGKQFRFSLANITISGGHIIFDDRPEKVSHTISELALNIPIISNLPYYQNIFVQPHLSALVNKTPVSFGGKTKPFHKSLETAFSINIEKASIPHYLAYVPYPLNFQVPSGLLSTELSVSWMRQTDRSPELVISGDISLENLGLAVDSHPFLTLPNFSVTVSSFNVFAGTLNLSEIALHSLKLGEATEQAFCSVPEASVSATAVDLERRTVRVGNFFSRDGLLVLRREKDGCLAFPRFLPAKETVRKQKEKIKPGPTWLVTVASAELSNYTVQAEDRKPMESVQWLVSKIRLTAKDVSTAENSRSPFTLNLLFNNQGSAALNGLCSLKPLSATVRCNLKGISVNSFQGYLADKVNLVITGGTCSSSGDFSLAMADGRPRILYQGEALIAGFASFDKVRGDLFLKWDRLSLSGLRFGFNPPVAEVKTVSLENLFSGLVVNTDRTTNAGLIFKSPAAGKEQKKTSGEKKEEAPEAGPLAVDKLVFKAGTLQFLDRSIQPNYALSLTELAGEVSGISSIQKEPGRINLEGKIEGQSPVAITGAVKPRAENLYLDVKVDFRDIDLTPATPYTEKYLGYVTRKGMLTLDLQYLIDNRKLTSQNRILLDQFTLGEHVDSPDATKLPVKLALALLRDINGQIQLDLPVSGSLDDPKFRIGPIIVQVLVNSITKAVTSPFKLLGALFGGGEDISFVEFDYGLSDLNSAARKLDGVIKAMQGRPGLEIEITGFVDPVNDTEQLRRAAFEKRLKTQKLKKTGGKGGPALSLEEITILPEEYQTYLWLAYKAENMPKKRNLIGFVEELPASEMEQKLLDNITVDENDLRLLAQARGLKVKDYLLTVGKISPERIFLIQPKTLAPEKKEGLKDSRVEFGLK